MGSFVCLLIFFEGDSRKFPIRTDRSREITCLVFFSTIRIALKQFLCSILIKVVRFKSGVRVRLTFRVQKVLLFVGFVGLILQVKLSREMLRLIT